MDYCRRLLLTILLTAELSMVLANWRKDWSANYVSSKKPVVSAGWKFEGHENEADNFKLLLVESGKAFIGGRNMVYYVSLTDFNQKPVTLEWEPDTVSIETCEGRGKHECQNYIRVLLRKSENLFYICGTNAYQPKCRHYKLENDQFVMQSGSDEPGTGVCPFDPAHNSTTLYTGGSLYSATVADFDSRDPLILQKTKNNYLMRTQPRDSMFLNEPNFVSSFEKDDKILFFFRETAIEHINCGKAVYSRVGRICKQDQGGAIRNFQSRFTSFFKARLNCSIPGEYPFYFDEIQSTSEIGQGNYRPTSNSGIGIDMIYGVFNTPDNSIQGSAVCAFMYSDIVTTFRGRFKGQDSFRHNWLPVSWESTPTSHPEKCTNNSMALSYESLDFIKSHPLMDEAVPAKGGRPMLVFTSFNARFTQISVDWQVLAADGLYYDVMFVGTDNGRVIKAINKGPEVESVVIEDIQVLDKHEPVTTLKVITNRMHKTEEKLLVMSKHRIVAIPLHRCDKAKTCSSCVALQDPYCAWNVEMKQCISAEAGFQSITTGQHDSCEAEEVVEVEMTSEAPAKSAECKCSLAISVEEPKQEVDSGEIDENMSVDEDNVIEKTKKGSDISVEQAGGKVGASSQKTVEEATVSADIFVIALVISIIFSLLIGFFIGFKVQSCRFARDQDVFYEQNSRSLQRGMGRNRLSSGDNPFFHTDHTSLAPKKLNHVVNMKNGKSNAETIPVTKSNKVYL